MTKLEIIEDLKQAYQKNNGLNRIVSFEQLFTLLERLFKTPVLEPKKSCSVDNRERIVSLVRQLEIPSGVVRIANYDIDKHNKKVAKLKELLGDV